MPTRRAQVSQEGIRSWSMSGVERPLMKLELMQKVLYESTLPSSPGVVSQLVDMIERAETNVAEFRAMIECDPVLTAKVLRAANSLANQSSRKVSTVVQAIAALGLKRIESIALGFSLLGDDQLEKSSAFSYRLHWRHALTTAAAARELVGDEPTLRDEAYVAGLLQDIGVLAIHRAIPERYSSVLTRTRHSSEELYMVERAELGVDHMELGHALLEHWKLPVILHGPIAVHHEPRMIGICDEVQTRLASVLCVAAQIGKVFCFSQDAEAIIRLRRLAHETLGISEEALEQLLCMLGSEIRTSAERAGLDANDVVSYQEVLARANQRLTSLALELGQELTDVGQRLTRVDQVARSLRVERFAAEDASRAKSEFLANLSHELRTPLTDVIRYSGALLSGHNSPEEERDYAQAVHKSAEHLLTMIDDILDMSRLEAGKLTVETISFAPRDVVTGVVSMMRPRADEKGLALELSYVGAIPARISSDPARLRQVLINLIGNAIKFTETGEVRVSVAIQAPTGTEGPRLRIDVSDTGVGIPLEHQAGLFEPFTQLDTSATPKQNGTGLGLAICRRLTGLMGGQIMMSSAPGQGSTFTVTIDAGSLPEEGFLDGPGLV